MSTPTLAMGGARVDLTFTAGSDVAWTASFVDVLGDPLDITASTWTAEILDGPGGDLLATVTVVENTSTLEFGLTDTETAALPRRCVWSLVESAAGDRPILSGSVTVSAAGSGGVTSSQGDTVTVALTPTMIEVQTIGAGGGGVEDIVHRADLDNPHQVNATDVGLGNVNNTSDANKPVSTAQQTALNGKANTSHNHVVADVTDAGALAALDEVTAPLVDSAAATDGYVLTADGAGGAAWEVVATGASTLGDLTDVGNGTPTNGNAIMGDGDSWESRALVKADVGLSNVDNTSDVNKPISTATQTALDGKTATGHTHSLANITDDGALAALNTVGTTQIDDGAVTLAKQANVVQARIFGRQAAGGTGVPEALTAAQAKTVLAIAAGDVSGLGALATLGTVGTTQIDNNAVTLGKLATMATDSFLGRDTAATGNVEVLSAATAKTILAITSGDVSGLGALATLSTVTATQLGTDAVTTVKILDANVTLAKLANLAQATFIGRQAGAGTGVPQALTAAQAKTALAIEAAELLSTGEAGGTKFLREDGDGSVSWQTVPSGGNPEGTSVLSTGETGAVKFLREDGDGTSSWQVPPGSATTLPGLTDVDDATVNTSSGHVLRANGSTWVNAQLSLADISGDGALAALNTVGTTEIDNNAVTLGKMATIATDSFLGRDTAATGNVEVLSAATAKTILAITSGDVSGLGALATLSTVTATQLGTDAVTSVKIQNSAVTLAKIANIATARILGRVTASSGVVEELTAAQTKTMLAIAAGDVSGLGALATLGTVGTTQIDNNAVTLGKMATIATDSFLGRDTAATGNVEVLSAATAKAILAIQGTELLSTGEAGGTKFLREDGDGTCSWQTVAGGGSLPALSDVDDATVNTSSGHVLRANGSTWINAQLAAGDVSGLGALATLGTVGTTQIDNNAVTLGKMATMATDSFLGRDTAATGNVEVLSAATAKTILAIAAGDVSGLGALATLSTVTASQLGSDAVTTVKILDANVTLAKMANIATDSFIGRDTAGSGVPEVLSAATAKTILAIAAGDVSGLGALATLSTVTATQLGTDAVTAVKIQADAVTTVKILNANVTLAKMADLAQSTIIGRAAGAGTGVPTALSNTQVKTLLAIASGDVSGLGALATLSTVTATELGTDAVTSVKIQNSAVTLAKIANIATARILGRVTASSGVVEELTAAQTKTMLAIASGDVSGLGALATLGSVAAGQIDTNAVTTVKILDANVTLAKLENRAQATFIGRASGAGTGVPQELTATQARTILNVADGATNVQAASTTVSGHSELATTAEIDAGTDTVRTMVPDLFAASRYGTKDMNVAVFGSSTACAVGNGTTGIVVPAALNGMNIIEVVAAVHTAGTTGTMDIQIRRRRGSTDTDVLSTKATIDTTEHTSVTAATAYVVNTANDDLATGDMIFVDVDAIHTTAALGLSVVISARIP